MDGISNHIVKISQDALIHPLTYLTNQIIVNSEYPTIWKIIRTIGLYKNKGSRDDPKNYRPISLLNPCSKAVEKELLSQMETHMKGNNLWNRKSFAYKKGHSTINALIDIMEVWAQNIDQNNQNISMFLDLSAAFDCIKHDIIGKKLEIYNFGPKCVKLIMSYLSLRSQLVTVGGQNSNLLWIKNGVPQGSILGPFLFNLYANELPAIIDNMCEHIEHMNNSEYLFNNECKICGIFINYADDSTIILKCDKEDYIICSNKLDHILSKMSEFLAANFLKLNIDKTQILRTTSRQQLAENKGEKIKLNALDGNGKNIVPSNTAKILGLTFSNNLTWAAHLERGKEAVLTKTRKKLGALKNVAKNCSQHFKKRLADACVMSRLVYGIQIWGFGVRPNTMKKVQTVQNMAACWILNKHRCTKTKDLLNELNWLSMYQLTIYHGVLLVWKIVNNMVPERNLESLEKSKNKTGRIELTDRRWCIRAQNIFWSLNNSIKNCSKIAIFKRKLKLWICDNIPIHEDPD